MKDQHSGPSEPSPSVGPTGSPLAGSGQAPRRQAEKIIRTEAALSPKSPKTPSPGKVGRTLHELQVHQVELEMQNEELRRVQAELEISQARYFDLYDLAPVGYLTLSEASLILEANLTLAGLLGVAKAILIRQPFNHFVLPEDRGLFHRRCAQLFETGKSQAFEMRLVRQDGTHFWVSAETRVAHNVDGAPVCRATISDATPHKQLEAALRRSEARYRSYLEVTGELGWTTNEEGMVVEDLPTWRHYTGQSREAIKGWGWLEALHPDDVERTAETWQKAVAKRQRYEIEYRVRRHDGVYREFLARGVPIMIEDGRILEWVGTCIDITEHRQAEAATHSMALFPEQNPMPVLRVSLAGELLYANSSAARLLAPWRGVGGARVPPAIAQAVAEAMASAAARELLIEADGRGLSFLVAPIPANGYANLYGRDITEHKRAEELLRANEERYRTVAEFTHDWEYWRTPDNRFLYVSPSCERITGYRAEEFLADADLYPRIVHPDDRERVVKHLQEDLLHPDPCEFEFRIVRRDGQVRWIGHVCRLVNDAQGRALGRRAANRDITERKQVETALRESESFYRQTLESIPGMVFTTRPEGYCDFQSQQWVEFTGVPMSEHLGDGWNALLHPEDQPRALVAWRDAVEGRAPYDVEYRVRRHDGEYEWFKVRARPIRDEAGQIVRWFGTAMNIDDLVKAQVALQRSQRLYRAIGESIDYGIWICEPDGRNTYASASFLKLVGLTQEQCSSFGWGDVLHPDDADRTIAAWKECVRTGGTWDIEHRFRGVDGQWHPILARGVPVRDEDGHLLCWAGINLDISRLRRSQERLRASLQEKEVLLQEIHHRVKNNLQVISSLINLQAATLRDPVLQASLRDVRDRVRTMALVHEKLYQSGNLTRLDFAEYVTSLLHHLWRAHGAAAANVRLTLAVEPVELPVDIAVTSGLILNELATNTLKHAFRDRPQGEVTVGLSRDAAAKQICLCVRDDGIGLPAGLDWRVSQTLGLRLVQMLAQQLCGNVEIGSGPGTEFWITFPDGSQP